MTAFFRILLLAALLLPQLLSAATPGVVASSRVWVTKTSAQILTACTNTGISMDADLAAWVPRAVSACGTDTYLVLTNNTDRIGFLTVKATGPVKIHWGNGTNETFNPGTGAGITIGMTNASAAARIVVIVGNVTYLNSEYTDGRTAFGGNVATMRKLTYLSVFGSNTLSGSVTGLTSLTYLAVGGSNTLRGSVSGLTSLTVLSVGGLNTLSGSGAGLTSLTYLYCGGNNTLSGWENIATNAVGLCYFQHGGLTALTSNQVDAVLAGFVLNSTSNHPARVDRIITLNAATASAPSAAGYASRDVLTNTVTPGGDGRKWTVNVK